MSNKGSVGKDFYLDRIAAKEEELSAIKTQLRGTLSKAEELKLTRDAEALIKEIDGLHEKISEADIGSPNKNIQKCNKDKILQKIDFREAKETADLIKKSLARNGGSVLFFLQKCELQMGDYCLDEVLSIILHDQVVDGQIQGSYSKIPIDLESQISRYNENEFLARLASSLNIEIPEDISEAIGKIKEKVKSSITDGATVFISIKGMDEVLDIDGFIKWFVKDFWEPFNIELIDVFHKEKGRLIIAMLAGSSIFETSPDEYFSVDGSCYADKIIELCLPDWTVNDIYEWMIKFRCFSSKMSQFNNPGLFNAAEKIHKDSKGTPQNVCLQLERKFL